jgi:hypothetical protein
MKFLKQMLLLSLILFSLQSKASLLIEPHVAYGMLGTSDYTLLGQTLKITYSGPQYGARLGFQTFGLMGGVDYTRSSLKFKTEILGTTTESDDNRDQVGVFVGYKFPILLRVWGGYYFTDKVTSATSNSQSHNGDYTSGTGTELGVGFTGLPFLSVNLMYRTSSYDTNYNAATGAKTTISPAMKTKEIALGFSLPLNL